MTKAELISEVAEQSGLKRVDAERAVAAFIESVTTVLKNGDKLSLVGFGTFCTAERASRKGKNPQTGIEITIPAATIPRFKPGKTLKEAVNTVK